MIRFGGRVHDDSGHMNLRNHHHVSFVAFFSIAGNLSYVFVGEDVFVEQT